MRFESFALALSFTLAAVSSQSFGDDIVIIQNFDGKTNFVQRGNDGPDNRSLTESNNIVIDLAVSQFEELNGVLLLNDEDQLQFDAMVKKARRNRVVTNEILQVALAQNIDNPKRTPDVSDIIDAAAKAEADVTDELCRWIETLTEEQQRGSVEFVASYEKDIDFIGVPFVSSFLGIEKNQAERIRAALARRTSNLRKISKGLKFGTQPSKPLRLEMIKEDAKVYNELTIKQLEDCFRFMDWIGADETVEDFVAKLDAGPRSALIENASNLKRVWTSMQSSHPGKKRDEERRH